MDVSGSLSTKTLSTTFCISFITVSEFQLLSEGRLRSSRFSKQKMGFRTQGQDGIPLPCRTSLCGKSASPGVALQPPRHERKRDVHNEHTCSLDGNGYFLMIF